MAVGTAALSGAPRAARGTKVEARGLTQRYGLTQVLRGLDLAVGTGVFGLLGPNGAGKTTLLRTLATINRPTGGALRLLDCDPADARQRREIRRRLGYLPQALGYYPNFTVFEFVEYFALLKEMPADRVRPAVARAIERAVDLGDRARAKLRTLSGGMLRRVGIAQAIVNDPELLLLDEPTAGLDPEQRVAFRALLREVGARGTVIVSTHLVEDVSAPPARRSRSWRAGGSSSTAPPPTSARGDGAAPGDSPLERGYSRVLAEARR